RRGVLQGALQRPNGVVCALIEILLRRTVVPVDRAGRIAIAVFERRAASIVSAVDRVGRGAIAAGDVVLRLSTLHIQVLALFLGSFLFGVAGENIENAHVIALPASSHMSRCWTRSRSV